MDIDLEKVGVMAALGVSLMTMWRNIASGGDRAKAARDERTVELLRIHVYPKLDEMRADMKSIKETVETQIPSVTAAVVKQTIESTSQQVFSTAERLIKLRNWESK